MGMRFTQDMREKANKVNLFAFVLDHYGDDFRHDGMQSIKLRDTKLAIRDGIPGYRVWNTDEKGNNIDFLVKYYGYTPDQAIHTLCGDAALTLSQRSSAEDNHDSALRKMPDFLKADHPKHTYAYLISRGIPTESIRMLLDKGLLFQEQSHNNMVFMSYKKDCAEIRGTNSYIPFHGIYRTVPKSFWYFRAGKKADTTTVYITEAAIDAISLYELKKHEPAIYASMAGVANQQIIDRIVNSGEYEVVLAVDNDAAGQECRERNPDLKAIIPISKDWNEDLQNGISP